MIATGYDGRPLVLLGAGGHASVLLALALAAGYTVVGVCDPKLVSVGAREWRTLPVLGGDEALARFNPDAFGLINGLGQMPHQHGRRLLYEALRKKGYSFPVMVHPYSCVAEDARLADGVQLMAGVVVQPGCTVGANTTINTGATVDHDCLIGAHVHIAPGVTLCGHVSVADTAYVGAGATVIQSIQIGTGAVIGAGVACVRNVAPEEVIINSGIRKSLT